MRIVSFSGVDHQFPDGVDDASVSKALKSWHEENLMKSPVESLELPAAEWAAGTYVDILADLEGTKAHASIEGGVDTRAYGVKYIPPGVDRSLKGKDLATAVAGWHQGSAAKKMDAAGMQMGSLGSGMQTMLVDLHYNTGSLFQSTPKLLASGDTKGAIYNTLGIIGATEGNKAVTYGGLATRRARVANLALAEAGLPTIAQVKMTKLDPRRTGGSNTEYQYLGADGQVLHTVRTSRPLSQTKLDGDSRVVDITSIGA